MDTRTLYIKYLEYTKTYLTIISQIDRVKSESKFKDISYSSKFKDIDISTRLYNCISLALNTSFLKNESISILSNISLQEACMWRSIGKKSINELCELCLCAGIELNINYVYPFSRQK
jgi:DNA-directed RNA polymerase alpha subunit